MDFSNWILEQLKEKDWSQADLAKRSNLTRATISNYVNGRIPDKSALRKLARALKLPPETVFEKAGVLPPKTPKDALIGKILYELDQLPENEREEIYQYIQFRRELIEKKGRYEAATKKKPASV